MLDYSAGEFQYLFVADITVF